jgi:hypothetical protein
MKARSEIPLMAVLTYRIPSTTMPSTSLAMPRYFSISYNSEPALLAITLEYLLNVNASKVLSTIFTTHGRKERTETRHKHFVKFLQITRYT